MTELPYDNIETQTTSDYELHVICACCQFMIRGCLCLYYALINNASPKTLVGEHVLTIILIMEYRFFDLIPCTCTN